MADGGIIYPESLQPEHLDQLLSRGWYRMGSGIFTCHYLDIEQTGALHRVHWLRYALDQLQLRKTHARLFKRNRRFQASISRLEVTDELEDLFQNYRAAIDFYPGPSVRECLLEEGKPHPFDSRLVALRDGTRLIAAGIFDVGRESVAGIMNFYHPDYKGFSPGRYLLLLKLEWSIQRGMSWFYPGYIVSHLPRFDYKLFPGEEASQIYLPEQDAWVPYDREYVDSFGKMD